MLLVGPNLFMGWSAWLIFDIQCPPSLGENWGVVTSLWTHHQTWWISVPHWVTDGLEITDRTPPFEPSWSTVFDRIVASSSRVASFFTDVTGLMMCSIWKNHPMASIFVFYALKFQSCPEVTRNQSDMCSDRIHNCLDMMWIWYTSLSLYVGNLCLLIRRKKLLNPHLLHMLPRSLLL
jgi:hypothetical protein